MFPRLAYFRYIMNFPLTELASFLKDEYSFHNIFCYLKLERRTSLLCQLYFHLGTFRLEFLWRCAHINVKCTRAFFNTERLRTRLL